MQNLTCPLHPKIEASAKDVLCNMVFLEISQNRLQNFHEFHNFIKKDAATGVSLWILWNF